MISIAEIERQQIEYEHRLRQPCVIQEPTRRRLSGITARDPDMFIADTAWKHHAPGAPSVAERVFGWDWDKPDASNPLGCVAYAARNGWFAAERQRGFERERQRMAANGWVEADQW